MTMIMQLCRLSLLMFVLCISFASAQKYSSDVIAYDYQDLEKVVFAPVTQVVSGGKLDLDLGSFAEPCDGNSTTFLYISLYSQGQTAPPDDRFMFRAPSSDMNLDVTGTLEYWDDERDPGDERVYIGDPFALSLEANTTSGEYKSVEVVKYDVTDALKHNIRYLTIRLNSASGDVAASGDWNPNVRLALEHVQKIDVTSLLPSSYEILTPDHGSDQYPGNIVSGSPVRLEWKDPMASIQNQDFCILDSALTYEIQVLRLYNTDPQKTDPLSVTANVDWNDALSVLIKADHYEDQNSSYLYTDLTIAEGTGLYIFRIRPIGDYYEGGYGNDLNWGQWTTPYYDDGNKSSVLIQQGDQISIEYQLDPSDEEGDEGGIDSRTSGVFYFEQPNEDKNWIYRRQFSEARDSTDRMSEQITYADELLRPVQQQRFLPSNSASIVTNTVSDYSGRPALQTIPYAHNRDLSNRTRMDFIDGVLTRDGIPYGPDQFDGSKLGSTDYAEGLVVEYYSGVTHPELQPVLPSSEGYPFIQTRYMGDGTGRPAEQSMPGKVHSIGGNSGEPARTTRTDYSSVSEQELIAIFGNEAPSASSVRKVSVTDPNGIVSVSYLNKDGQAIASCLVKTPNEEELVITLPNELDNGSAEGNEKVYQQVVTDELSGDIKQGAQTYLRQKRFSFPVETQLSLEYTLPSALFKVIEGTDPPLCVSLCAECDYEVVITLKNANTGEIIVPQAGDNSWTITNNPDNINCESTPQPTTITLPVINLGPGTYILERKITGSLPAENIETVFDADDLKVTALESFQKQIETATRNKLMEDDPAQNADLQDIVLALETLSMEEVYNLLSSSSLWVLNGEGDAFDYMGTNCGAISLPLIDCELDLSEGFDENGNSKFEEYLFSTWSEENDKWSNTTTPNRANLKYYFYQYGSKLFDGYPNGTFNDLIDNMVGDPELVGTVNEYDAGELWFTWKSLVDNLSQFMLVDPESGQFDEESDINKDFDLFHTFLSMIGTTYAGITDSEYTYLTEGHKFFFVEYSSSSDAPYKICGQQGVLTQNGFDLFDGSGNVLTPGVWTRDHRSTLSEDEVPPNGPEINWRQLYECIRMQKMRVRSLDNAIKEGELGDKLTELFGDGCDFWTEGGAAPSLACVNMVADALQDECEDRCEMRREQFELEARSAYEDAQIAYTDEELDCAVESLIEECKSMCELTVLTDGSNNPLGIGTPSQQDNYTKVMGGDPVVTALGSNQLCPSGTSLVVPTRSGSGNESNAAFVLAMHEAFNKTLKNWNWEDLTLIEFFLNKKHCQEFRKLFDHNLDWPGTINCEELDCVTLDFPYSWSQYVPTSTGTLSGVFPGLGDSIIVHSIVVQSEYTKYLYQDFLRSGDTHEQELLFGGPQWSTSGGGNQEGEPSHVNQVVMDIIIPENDPCKAHILFKFAFVDFDNDFGVEGLRTRHIATDEYELESYYDYGGIDLPQSAQGNSYAWFDFNGETAGGTDGPAVFYWTAMSTNCFDICLSACGPDLCLDWIMPNDVVIDLDDYTHYRYKTCEDQSREIVQQELATQIEQIIASSSLGIEEAYAEQCLDEALLNDQLKLTYELSYYHYTLYYYDEVGRLVQTVPPAGVDVDQTRSRQDKPQHTFVTKYKYNSLGQLTDKRVPDAETNTQFWYSSLGQLRFSRDGRQWELGNFHFSYSKYDQLGRTIESGEVAGIPLESERDNMSYPQSGYTTRILTTYTDPYSDNVSTFLPAPYDVVDIQQRYLHNRVSYVIRDNDGNIATTGDQVVTIFSYDPHGNVEWVMQRIPAPEAPNNEIVALIEYKYDLLSSNVREVHYNAGRPDQFHHRYEYDEDNRITAAYTSRDGEHYERDTKYKYYPHGPLQRIEVGDDGLQGMDYVYTIQGWLKGMNHPSEDPLHDPGQDGLSTNTVNDVYGMVLGYYEGDFVSSQPGSSSYASDGSSTWQTLIQSRKGLYNGNIRTWELKSDLSRDDVNPTPASTHGNQYEYDVLNRILNFKHYAYQAGGPYSFNSDYAGVYSYDENGNLLSLRRLSPLSGLMDDLVYTYETDGNLNKINRLAGVVDNASMPNQDNNDIEGSHFYTYDGAGNLKSDTGEDIQNIDWTLDGKVGNVQKTNESIEFAYDATGNRVLKSYDNGTTVTNTYYIRDASGLIMATYTNETEGNPPGGGEPLVAGLLPSDVKVKEWPMYGSGAQSRIGTREGRETLYTIDQPVKDVPKMTEILGHKNYEITDHLGNVRVTFRDVHIEGGKLNITSNVDYYPFGMQKEAETYNQSGYTFGFNGMEKDDEVKGEGNSLDFGARIYDPRVGRWLSRDPLEHKYFSLSPFNFSVDNPILFVDPDGQEVVWFGWKGRYSSIIKALNKSKVFNLIFTRFIKNQDNVFITPTNGGYFGWAPAQRGTKGYNIHIGFNGFIKNGELTADPTLIAKVILHEGLHSRYHMARAEGNLADYPTLNRHYSQQATVAGYEGDHEAMAEGNVGTFIQGMREFDDANGTQHSDDWYNAMAWWGSLSRATDDWNNLDSKTRAVYVSIQNNERAYMHYLEAKAEYNANKTTANKTAMDSAKKAVDWKLFKSTRTKTKK